MKVGHYTVSHREQEFKNTGITRKRWDISKVGHLIVSHLEERKQITVLFCWVKKKRK